MAGNVAKIRRVDTHPKITCLNRFRAVVALNKVAADDRVQEIEGEGMDEGRVFIHLKPGYILGGGHDTHSFSVGSIEEMKYKMSLVKTEKDIS